MACFICVEPLTLLLSLLLSPWATWATSGALAALMDRTVMVAFHPVALLATLLPSGYVDTKDPLAILPAFDLDIIGINLQL